MIHEVKLLKAKMKIDDKSLRILGFKSAEDLQGQLDALIVMYKLQGYQLISEKKHDGYYLTVSNGYTRMKKINKLYRIRFVTGDKPGSMKYYMVTVYKESSLGISLIDETYYCSKDNPLEKLRERVV